MSLISIQCSERSDLVDIENSEFIDEEPNIKTETNANLQYCSNVIVGNKLKGPIKVEKMIVHGGGSKVTKRAIGSPDIDEEDIEYENTEYNIGSIAQMFDKEGLRLLKDSFRKNPRPDKVERDRLADLTGTRRKFVRKWFAIERSRRKSQITWKEPLSAINILWTFSSREYRRNVRILGSLLGIYGLVACYCICNLTWYELSIVSGISFVIMNMIVTFLNTTTNNKE